MEDSTPLHVFASRSFSASEISLLKSVEALLHEVFHLQSLLERLHNDLKSKKAAFGSCVGDGHFVEVVKLTRQDELPRETQFWHRTSGYGFWRRCPNRADVVVSKPKRSQNDLPQETRRWLLREYFNVVKSKLGQLQDELPHEILYRAIRTIERKQDERWGLLRVADYTNRLRHIVKRRPEQDERPREPSIQQARDFVAELDRINHNYKTTTNETLQIVSALLDGDVRLYVSAPNIAGTHGIGKTGIGYYVSAPVKQQSEWNKSYSQSPPISGNRKAEDLKRGSQEEDRDPNGGMTVITVRDEDERSGYGYNSSFASAQLLTLAVSSLLLCLMVLFPDFAKKNQAITAAALMSATLGSLVSLETIPKWPNWARTCGYLAVLSLLVALASLLSSSLNWVTI